MAPLTTQHGAELAAHHHDVGSAAQHAGDDQEHREAEAPTIAISAGQVSVAVDGRSAMITPTNPATTALQRRQPTCSLRNSAEIAVT